MSTSTLNASDFVEPGDSAVVLRALQNHSELTEARLKSLTSSHLGRDEIFSQVLQFLEEKALVLRLGDVIRLNESGQLWLEQNSALLAVEEEDSSSKDQPTKPYDVAKLKMETKHLSVFQALRKIEKKEIELRPEFQRAFVWDVVRQSRLIESLLIRIPLPAFYLDATDQVKWNVVDGLQRLTTLYRYCREQAFALEGLQFLDLYGRRFDELPPQYKVLIEDDTQLLFYNLMPGTPLEAKFTIFSRVNTGGMQLTPQEIRHALGQGPATNLLERLSKSKEFRDATEGAVESLRMSDRELVLRSLAFMHFGVEAYRQHSELDSFLLHAMDNLNRIPEHSLNELAATFLASVATVRSIFGRYAFRKFYERGGRRGPINKALFEVWTTCVRTYDPELLETHKEKIISGFIDLLSEPSSNFARAISVGTGSYNAVSTRFTAVQDLLLRISQ